LGRIETYIAESGSSYLPNNAIYKREITYDDNNNIIEFKDNWGKNGRHYKKIDGKMVELIKYEPYVVIPRRRKHNTWDK
jgi:hypothetical protein